MAFPGGPGGYDAVDSVLDEPVNELPERFLVECIFRTPLVGVLGGTCGKKGINSLEIVESEHYYFPIRDYGEVKKRVWGDVFARVLYPLNYGFFFLRP